MALISNAFSLVFRFVFFVLLYVSWGIKSILFLGIPGSIDTIITFYFIFTIYFMKSLLYFDINIPVDGWGIGEKVDAMGDAIPGL